MVLLLGIGNARLSNAKIDFKQTVADAQSLLSILRAREDRWPSAVRLLCVSLVILQSKPDFEH